MTQVDFYILDTQALDQRALFVCRLGEKALRQGLKVLLHLPNADDARALDDLLWRFRPDSFIPHGLSTDGAEHPLGIGWEITPSSRADLLINLCPQVPEAFGRFPRIAEIIVQHPSVRDPGRENFRFYKQQGCVVKDHRITPL